MGFAFGLTMYNSAIIFRSIISKYLRNKFYIQFFIKISRLDQSLLRLSLSYLELVSYLNYYIIFTSIKWQAQAYTIFNNTVFNAT